VNIKIALILLLSATIALARTPQEQTRIDYLIASLGELRAAVFIRNGSEYDAAAAQKHLQQKLRYAGDRVQTAEQFIKYCASESSMSHKPYQIRLSDGRVQNTADFFTAKLRKFDKANQR
jgi:hypothetical protein